MPQATKRLERLKEARKTAQKLMTQAQTLWVKHKATPKYEEGDMVWLDGHNIKMEQPAAKLVPRRHGPFPINQVMSPVTYRLKLPKQWGIHPVFHTDLLTPYHKTVLHGDNYQRPPPDLIDGEEEYEVEAILDSRKFGRTKRQQYLVKWKGYPDADNQWLNKDDVFAEDAIREFKRCHPTKETHIKALGERAESPTPSFPSMSTSDDDYPGPHVDIHIPVCYVTVGTFFPMWDKWA